MIRILILGNTLSETRRVAKLLSDETQFDIVEAATASSFHRRAPPLADLIVTIGALPDYLNPEDIPIVSLADATEPAAALRHPGAWLGFDATAAEIAAAIIAVAAGLTVLTREQARFFLTGASLAGDDENALLEALTARESQVLRMLANGLGNKDIARQLGISNHTAKYHVAQILAKLRAGSRTEAVTIAIRRGIVPI